MDFIKKFLDGLKIGSQEEKSSRQGKGMSILEANAKLKRTNELANIANKTTDREEFYNSINEIKDILRELTKYEGRFPFTSSPSADLRNLERIEQKQIELLEKRISEKSKNAKKLSNSETDKENQDIKGAYKAVEIQMEKETAKIISPLVQKTKKKSNDLLGNFGTDGLDPYFIEAGRFVIEKEKASIGMMQRMFKIGFNRAARIMDQLAESGVVGEEEGTKPRKILMTAEMFERYIEGDVSEDRDAKEESENIYEDIPSAETILKDNFGIQADFSNDGECLKNLENIIVPSVSNEIQIEIINMLLEYNSPQTMFLLLIDNSVINYSAYNGVPQLIIPVVTEKKKIDSAFHWCFAEMQDRINKFVECGVKNIDSFNKKMADIGEKPCQKIVCVVNESNSFFESVSMPLERMFLNSNMVGIYFILFSRFSLKNLSLGTIGELLKVLTADKLRMLLSQSGNSHNGQNVRRNFDDMGGHEFERFCANILKKNDFENVEVT